MMTAEQLKGSILQLAMQGKLVEQRSSEGTGEDLYKEIQTEKKRLLKEGALKKQKPLLEITVEEMPFDIPESWKWVKLGDISSYAQPKEKVSPKDITPEMWSLDLEDIEKGTGKVLNHVLAKERKIQGDKVRFKKGNILYSKLRPYLLKILIADNEGITTPELVPFNIYGINDSKFFLWYLRSPYVDNAVNSVSYGVKMPRVGTETMVNLLVPLPPLAEQKRIVAKIEELMPFVERYADASTKLNTLNATFPEMMKKSILQEAVQGKLVPQDPNDEPASLLLKKIAEEKKRLIKDGRIKAGKKYNSISEEEIAFDIPETWMWARLSDVVFNRGQKKPENTFSYIDIGSIDNVHQKLNDEENIIEAENAPSRARKIVASGDVIYSTVRPYLHNMCIIDREFSHEPIASTGFAAMTCHEGLYNKYLFYFLLSPDFDRYANDTENSKGVAYPAINDQKLYKALVPIPPLNEQKRIVAKIEELMSFVDDLKN